MEHLEDDEAQTIEQLGETLNSISEKTFADSSFASRSVHAKTHGVMRGKLTVPAGLPPGLAQGMFAKAGVYTVHLRLSTIPGDIMDDAVSTPRGMAIKIVGVEGERLPGSEGEKTQDFVLVNSPAFAAPSAKKFLGEPKLLAVTTVKGTATHGCRQHADRGFFGSVARGPELIYECWPDQR